MGRVDARRPALGGPRLIRAADRVIRPRPSLHRSYHRHRGVAEGSLSPRRSVDRRVCAGAAAGCGSQASLTPALWQAWHATWSAWPKAGRSGAVAGDRHVSANARTPRPRQCQGRNNAVRRGEGALGCRFRRVKKRVTALPASPDTTGRIVPYTLLIISKPSAFPGQANTANTLRWLTTTATSKARIEWASTRSPWGRCRLGSHQAFSKVRMRVRSSSSTVN